ncbi:helix-turn-helix transcriptional regulator [Mariniflexile litorale]|uniref:Helix-turn-helix transcriptional regulator n=1 Tax=Mariniflexile litorale TaxID=3045158 RepID=A0AAU7EFH6_9FLAO|nr:helix-turn-helix transcriptional regulator [Mariniflexile sp. KMM 9835]MDQ8212286.1 helix-turn-helix transcriptional regulator [Mariniflexile sp. KMM 9835]
MSTNQYHFQFLVTNVQALYKEEHPDFTKTDFRHHFKSEMADAREHLKPLRDALAELTPGYNSNVFIDLIKKINGFDNTLISYLYKIKPSKLGFVPPFIIRLNKVLENNYSLEEFDVTKLSKHLNLCLMQTNRKIKKHLGVSAGNCLRYYRLFKALELLIVSDSSVKEITFFVGFRNPSNFTQTFKRVFGETPTEIRRCLFDKC